MARPQTENLKAFDVASQSWRPQGLPDGIDIRALNEDDESGAVTAVLDVPAGWSWKGSGYCFANQDFFVLDGAIRIGEHTLENGGFCYYPMGVVQGGWGGPVKAVGCTPYSTTGQSISMPTSRRPKRKPVRRYPH